MDRVLIVDDDKQLCALLIERLKGRVFALETVYDGVRGLERALSGDHALVILDLMLPGLGGIDLLRQLRAQSDIPRIDSYGARRRDRKGHRSRNRGRRLLVEAL